MSGWPVSWLPVQGRRRDRRRWCRSRLAQDPQGQAPPRNRCRCPPCRDARRTQPRPRSDCNFPVRARSHCERRRQRPPGNGVCLRPTWSNCVLVRNLLGPGRRMGCPRRRDGRRLPTLRSSRCQPGGRKIGGDSWAELWRLVHPKSGCKAP